ncbi:ATP-dependent RNA helicase ddx24-like, partial [Diaphorina citri]|uniref:RNA helicase n=1 Tax=Diaphorina citri TaxID=121845 RepID=A0A1S3DSF0_DIACI
ENTNDPVDQVTETEEIQSDEPSSKKLKQKKKKKQTYTSANKELLEVDTSNNEDMFVQMAEWVKFNIPETIIRALYQKGFKTPTKIQSMKNKTVVIGAPKTSAKIKDGGVKKKRKKKKPLKTKVKSKTKFNLQEEENNEEEERAEADKEKTEDINVTVSSKKKKLKRKQNPSQVEVSELSANTNDPDDQVNKTEEIQSDEPHSKKLKQKKKKKQTYTSANKELLEVDTSNNEDMFVQMAEWVKFNIPETIIRALYQKGFKTPTKIQSMVMPSALLARKDIVGAAETGSGKTLAFGIPILTGIVNKLENPTEEDENDSGLEEEAEEVLEELEEESANTTEFVKKTRNKLYALILAPTRELAIQ